jgi:hypothetical protein
MFYKKTLRQPITEAIGWDRHPVKPRHLGGPGMDGTRGVPPAPTRSTWRRKPYAQKPTRAATSAMQPLAIRQPTQSTFMTVINDRVGPESGWGDLMRFYVKFYRDLGYQVQVFDKVFKELKSKKYEQIFQHCFFCTPIFEYGNDLGASRFINYGYCTVVDARSVYEPRREYNDFEREQ